MSFRALLLTQDEDGGQRAEITDLDDDDLPEGDVVVDVEYSTLNYKDGLAILGRKGIVRSWPMIPGVDLAGTVRSSETSSLAPGDRIAVNGWDVGEKYWGGYAQRASLRADWITPLPDAISTRQAMAIGTAGYTAMLCVLALEEHGIEPGSGPVVVTGAAGGVGSVAIAVLARLGYEVHAVTGRVDTQGDYLRGLGAAELVDRNELTGDAPALGTATYAGGVDAVGGTILANILATTRPHGCVAACGLAQSMSLPTSVAPFILRGVTLAGVNSVHEPPDRRDAAWSRLATDLDPDVLASMTTEVGLADVIELAPRIVAGEIRGRIVVDVNA